MRSVLTPRVTRVPRGPPSEPGIADSGFPVACALAWTKIYVPLTYPARGIGCRADSEERGGYECRNQTFPSGLDLSPAICKINPPPSQLYGLCYVMDFGMI